MNAFHHDQSRRPSSDPMTTGQPGPIDKIAGALAGLILGVAIAGIGAWIATGTWVNGQVLFVALAGAVIGLIVGYQCAVIETLWGGAFLGAGLPVGLCLLELLRRLGSGRAQLTDVGKDLSNPKGLLVLGCVLAGGALLGVFLVGLRQIIVRLFRTR